MAGAESGPLHRPGAAEDGRPPLPAPLLLPPQRPDRAPAGLLGRLRGERPDRPHPDGPDGVPEDRLRAVVVTERGTGPQLAGRGLPLRGTGLPLRGTELPPSRYRPLPSRYGPLPSRYGPLPSRYGPLPSRYGPLPSRYRPLPSRYRPPPGRARSATGRPMASTGAPQWMRALQMLSVGLSLAALRCTRARPDHSHRRLFAGIPTQCPGSDRRKQDRSASWNR